VARKRTQSDVLVVGASAHPLRDVYHFLMEMSWPNALGLVAALFLVINGIFAIGYLCTGGIANAQTGSFADAFFFSVQTLATVGYGSMYPTTLAANVLMTLESILSLIVTALSTGMVFARFSRTTGEVIFSRKVTISPFDGVPTVAFRIGNDRSNTIFDAKVTVTMFRTEKTKEGVLIYRMYDVALVRSSTPALERSFTVMHRIDEKSPLHDATPETCEKSEVEIAVAVIGTDDISLQPVHARHVYKPGDFAWGQRLADILREREDGKIELDVRKFHDVVPVKAA